MGITVYPVSQRSSHLTIRADVFQKRDQDHFEPVFSSNFYLACRDKALKQKFILPPINLAHSDDENLAKQRSKLAEDTIALVKDVNPLDVYARPPS